MGKTKRQESSPSHDSLEFRDQLLAELQATVKLKHELELQLQTITLEHQRQASQLESLHGLYQTLLEENQRDRSFRVQRLAQFLNKWGNPLRYARFIYRRLKPWLKRSAIAVPPSLHEGQPVVRSVERLVPEPIGPLSVKYKVSVVIPTYNGGGDLPYLLRSLSQQQGCEVEIIAVDSGSTDETIALLGYFGVTIIPIKNSEFTHSHARNLGVGKARHPLTLCTVQDALPTDMRWLYRACALMERTGCDALSLAQVPRSDADLFAAINIAEFNEYLEISHGRTNITTQLSSDQPTRRKQAQLDNVATLYLTSSLLERPFEGAYGEDINIGIRLVSDGRLIGKTGECQVIHSHARKPGYYLKRYFVDTKHLLLNQILTSNLQERDFSRFKRGFVFALAFVLLVRREYLRGESPQSADRVLAYLRACKVIDPVFVNTDDIRTLLRENLPNVSVFDRLCDPAVLFEQAKMNGGEVFQHALFAFQRQVKTFAASNTAFDGHDQDLLYLTLQQSVFGTAGSLIAYYDHLGLIPPGDRGFVDSLREKV